MIGRNVLLQGYHGERLLLARVFCVAVNRWRSKSEHAVRVIYARAFASSNQQICMQKYRTFQYISVANEKICLCILGYTRLVVWTSQYGEI